MKKVIFICLLSISMCFSLPTADKPTAEAAALTSTISPNATSTKVEVTTPKVAEPTKQTNTSEATPAHNETSVPTASTTKDPKEATTKTATTEATIPTADAANKTQKETTEKPTPTVPPTEGKPKNETATTKDDKTNGTTVLTPSTTPKPSLQARAFDGPSFIGGIILTLGLLAIGFMGFKYYKNQTERNYHTL